MSVDVSVHFRGDTFVSAYTRSDPPSRDGKSKEERESEKEKAKEEKAEEKNNDDSPDFKTEKTIASHSPNNPQDTLALKESLNKLGYYDTPDWGIEGFSDRQMFDSIKAFQKDHGLKTTGIINPGDETEKILDKQLKSINENNMTPIDGSLDEKVNKDNSYLKNFRNWLNEKERVSSLRGVSDNNKHQYLSCLAGKGGSTMAFTGLGMGIGKELWDFSYKATLPSEREKYNGIMGVGLDGGKDMINNLRGLKHGYIDKRPCINLLERKIVK